MKGRDILFSSNSDEWETPQMLFDELNSEFGFTHDVCATAQNTKCRVYYDIECDGLKQDWLCDHVVWCNPPLLEHICLGREGVTIDGNYCDVDTC